MSKSKPQLHELLAAESDASSRAKKITDETFVTLSKKAHLFSGKTRKTVMMEDDRSGENLTEEENISDTVPSKLNYMSKPLARYFDITLQKELTNQEAKADLIVDGEVVFEGAPATFLLGMETRLANLRHVYDSIPTLDPSYSWKEDKTQGKNIFTSNQVETFKTEKSFEHKIMVEPTEFHPAQVKEYTVDKKVGRISTKHFSGMISPARKSELLGNIDKLITAVKSARMRANSTEVKTGNIGDTLFKLIHS